MTLKSFVLITAIIEIGAGALLFIMPSMVPEMHGESAMAFTLARMYGAAALAVGYYALMVWKNFSSGPARGFLKTYLVFHIGVAVAAFGGYSSGINNFILVSSLHIGLALLTIFYIVQMRNQKI